MTTCTISGVFESPVPLKGARLLMTPDATAVFTSDGIVVRERYTCDIDPVTGVFSITVPATDTGNPTGWTYSVTEDFNGGRFYHIAAPTGSFNLMALAPVPATEGDPIVIGPAGPSGGSLFPPFHQTSAAATWTITHNLGLKPAVAVFADDDPTHPAYTDVSYPDNNTVVIAWPSAESGWVYF